MEETEEQQQRAMRIFIGGVGPTVTAADIEKTFSPLGLVGAVELVRTNGRSFAYMDFNPTSDKTLAKLFSAYNGCSWKGGKLKLERAKEQYLERLKREWTEDEKLMSEKPIVPVVEKVADNPKLTRADMEKMEMRIFFPKLRKVRSLPFKGSGKHKYSFQRIEVPPLPIHFCDCEEHWELSGAASEKYISSLTSGVHYEKELSIMNTVMNKLFDKESIQLVDDKESTLAATGIATGIADPSTDYIHEELEEVMDMDADNLVTNIGVNNIDDILKQFKGERLAANQEPRVGDYKSSREESTQNKANTKKRKIAAPADTSEVVANKRSHTEMPVKITENEFAGFLPQTMSSRGHSQEQDVSVEPFNKSQTESSMPTTQSAKGLSWLQKSSWKGLVGASTNSSFNITKVLPGISSTPKEELTESTAKKTKSSRDRNKSKKLAAVEAPLPEKEVDEEVLEKEDCVEAYEDASGVAADKRVNKESSVEISENKNEMTAVYSQDEETSIEPANKSQTDVSSIARGQFWLQKSSWRDLVGGTANTPFSITNVLPEINSLLPKQPKSNHSIIETSGAAKKIKAIPDTDKSKHMPVVPDSQPEKESSDEEIQGKGDCIQANKDTNETEQPKPVKPMPQVGVSEVCTFMRSAESEKEWSKARSALSKYLKKHDGRKNDEDDSRKSTTGLKPRKKI